MQQAGLAQELQLRQPGSRGSNFWQLVTAGVRPADEALAAPSAPELLLLVLLASGLGPALGVALGEALVPDSIFYQQDPSTGDVIVMCQQDVQLAGDLVGSAEASTPTECAQACRQNAQCDVFTYIECSEAQVANCTECGLYSIGCTIAPVALPAPAGVPATAITTGFPICYELNDVPGFTAQAGQGVPGADIVCEQSLIPGKCALASTADAIITCVRTPDCLAVVHYVNGTDGCSEPVSLLVHDALTQSGAFMSPSVATLSRIDAGSLTDTTLMASDGLVAVLPANELPEAGVPTDSNTTWLGCIVAHNVLMSGTLVDTLDNLVSAEECCHACRNNTGCNMFTYCGLTGGCSYSRGPRTLALNGGQCQLMYSEMVGGPFYFPPAVVAKGPSVPFTGGAPLVLSAPPTPGFTELPGRNQFAFTGGSFNCSFTEIPQVGECAVFGTLEQVAARCNETAECAGMIISPGRTPGTVQANLKTLIDPNSVGLSPSNGLYLKAGVPMGETVQQAEREQAGSGLSTGTVVGIAVGSAAAVAAGAVAVWVLLHHRRAVRASSLAAAKASSVTEQDIGKVAAGSGTAGSTCGEVLVLGVDDSHVGASASSAPPSGGTGDSAASRSSGAVAGGVTAVAGGGPRGVTHPADGPVAPRRAASPFAGGPRGGGGGGPAWAANGSGWGSGPLPAGQRGVRHPADLGQSGGGPRVGGAAPSPFSGGPRSARPSLDIARAGSGAAPSPFFGGPRSARPSPDAGPRSARPSLDGGRPCPAWHDPGGRQFGIGGGTAEAVVSPFAAGGPGSCPASPFDNGPANGASAPPSIGTDGGAAPVTPAGTVTAELAASLTRSRAAPSPFAAARARAVAAAAAGGGGGGLSRAASGTPSALETPAASFGAHPGGAGAGTLLREAQPSAQPSTVSSRGGIAFSSTSTAGSADLPELAAHVAECDAAMSWGGEDVSGPLLREHSLIQPGSLPSSLRDLIVDINDIEFLFWPNGAPMELGAGASAVVFKVLFRGEVCAAKEVDLGRSPAIQELFVQEAERLHQLRHAHVVALYGVALSGSRGIILMEYCSGRDLHSALQLRIAGTQRRLFGWYARGRHVAVDIAKALNFLHSKGCVHMDIKSSNVLLTGSGTAKLADIGLARLQQGTHLSDMPNACGTFAWMAPEVIMGSRCTSAVDIFSFGVVLWELITGEAPKRGEMRLPEVPRECPQEAADLITRCMSLEPRDRPTAQQLMQQLAAMKGRKGGQGGGHLRA
ncbi:hypothetical protein ABPG75_007063 [Micractinium tetrahymenae]